MTVSYSQKLGQDINLLKLLFRWKGSIYKLIWVEFMFFICFYTMVTLIKIFAVPKSHEKSFKEFCEFALSISETIPVAFVLAFFVRLVVNRSFAQFKSIPWIDKMALYLAAFLQGTTDQIVILRRTIIRYMVLSMTLSFRSISTSVMKTFKSKDQLVSSGLVTLEEIERINLIQFNYNRFFVPLIWATDMIRRADRRGHICGERCVALLVNEITSFHESLQSLFFYDWINIPLVYTQVSTICTYAYFIFVAFGGQIFGTNLFIKFQETRSANDTNLYQHIEEFITYMSMFPTFGVIQFFIYMGWLKVAEAMINPYGEDDEDFDMVALIERNIQIGYMIVDKVNKFPPKLTEDIIPIYLQANFYESQRSNRLFFGSIHNVYDENLDGNEIKKQSSTGRSKLWAGTHFTKNPILNESGKVNSLGEP